MTCSHSDAGSNNGVPRGFATKNEVVIVKSSLPNNTQNVLFKVQWSRVLPPQRPPKPAHGQLNLAALPPTPSTHHLHQSPHRGPSTCLLPASCLDFCPWPPSQPSPCLILHFFQSNLDTDASSEPCKMPTRSCGSLISNPSMHPQV